MTFFALFSFLAKPNIQKREQNNILLLCTYTPTRSYGYLFIDKILCKKKKKTRWLQSKRSYGFYFCANRWDKEKNFFSFVEHFLENNELSYFFFFFFDATVEQLKRADKTSRSILFTRRTYNQSTDHRLHCLTSIYQHF